MNASEMPRRSDDNVCRRVSTSVETGMETDRRAAKREEILAVTWRLIAREGLRAASMRNIASAAGYANGALAYYFSGKEDLLRAAFSHVFERTERRIAEATQDLRGLAAIR